MRNKAFLCLVLLSVLAASSSLLAQDKPPAPGQEPPRRGMGGAPVMGVVTSVGVDRFQIKQQDGTTQTVLVNDQTRYRQGQQEFQLEDLKVGDHVFVRGTPNSDKQVVALGVRRLTEQQFQRFQSGALGGGRGGPRRAGRGPGGWQGGPGPGNRAGGEILSIEKNQIRVRGRQGERVIVVNDQTAFSKEGQSIALKDLKVGDHIFALEGEVDGQFVATQVRSVRMGMGPGRRGGAPGAGPQAPTNPPAQP
jgi:Domain of unknown function (DUF5666)